MRSEAAIRIQIKMKQIKRQKITDLETNMIVDQVKFKSSVKIIQRWYRAISKTIKAKRSTVNPAVEQVLKDPERV